MTDPAFVGRQARRAAELEAVRAARVEQRAAAAQARIEAAAAAAAAIALAEQKILEAKREERKQRKASQKVDVERVRRQDQPRRAPGLRIARPARTNLTRPSRWLTSGLGHETPTQGGCQAPDAWWRWRHVALHIAPL